tara:strand:+ start:25182 stop:25448 length:267 start_codon:yes stop_codon:yes gene_type:complete
MVKEIVYADFAEKYDRFVVTNYGNKFRNSYSTIRKEAYAEACDCADYEKGRVFGEKQGEDGERNRVKIYTSKKCSELEKEKGLKKNGN